MVINYFGARRVGRVVRYSNVARSKILLTSAFFAMSLIRNKNYRRRVLVIAHDAGGGEIIAAYVKKHRANVDFFVYVAGPAYDVFRREKIPCKRIGSSLEYIRYVVKKHKDVAYILLDTGGWSSIPLYAFQVARRMGIMTCAYLDSWVLYRERFGYPKRGWRNNLPDEIWVGDVQACILARRYFPYSRVRYVSNQYFKNNISYFRSKRGDKPARKIIFMSDARFASESMLSMLLNVLSYSSEPSIVRIRLHPNDSSNRYDQVIANTPTHVRVEISRKRDIVHDLLTAKLVIGMQTTALALAYLAGIKTMRLMGLREHSILPFRGIHKIWNVQGLTTALRKQMPGFPTVDRKLPRDLQCAL